MQQLGQLFENKRRILGYSLKEASDKLKIRIEYLLAIEKNNFEDTSLPAQVYMLGYVKLYANFLGIKANEIEDIKSSFVKEVIIPEPKIAYNDYKPNNLTVFSTLMITLVIYFSWYSFTIKPENFNTQEIASLQMQPLDVSNLLKDYSKNIENINLVEVQTNHQSNLRKFHNNEELAFLAKSKCNLKIFSAEGKLFADKELNEGDMYFVSNKLDLTIAVTHQDSIEIFDNKQLILSQI
ncbi:MAG: helix-turn-helix domain-containing protein [Alphaproteobacteria bacterium]